MRLKCCAKTGADLPELYLDSAGGITRETEFHLTAGECYVVYGIVFKRSQVWYYICDDLYTWYPREHPSPLFDIVDGRMSRFWSIQRIDLDRGEKFMISFPEWAMDRYFYDRLVQGLAEEQRLFKEMKSQMDTEFGIMQGDAPRTTEC